MTAFAHRMRRSVPRPDAYAMPMRVRLLVDTGGIVVLGIGVMGLLLGLTAVVVDVGQVAHQHLTLAAATERIALAGAMAVDTTVEPTTDQPGTRLRLFKQAAAKSARAAAADEAQHWPGLRVKSLQVQPEVVSVRVCGSVVLPLHWRSVGNGSQEVCASAAAATAISWAQYP